MKFLAVAAFILIPLSLAQAGTGGNLDNLAKDLSSDSTLVDVSDWDGVDLDIRYATNKNFTGKNVYGSFKRCFLHGKAAEGLKRSIALLQKQRPGWQLLIFDCLRPNRAQKVLFNVVKGTPQQKYVMNPAKGSLHSYGFALDLSIITNGELELDMGTPYDYFGKLSEPIHEQELLSAGKLTKQQIRNRQLLRSVMREGGFHSISTEWWHFDLLPGDEVRSQYKKIE